MGFCKFSFFIVSFMVLLTGAVIANDFVDIGLPSSETGHNLQGWGPIEPATSGGAYGGIDHCRAIWTSGETPIPDGRFDTAYIDMNFVGGPELVSFQHLDGPADDSFEIWMGTTLVYSYTDSGLSGERWYVDGFNYTPAAAGTYTLRFEATGVQWSSWATYGQVAIAGIWIGPGGPVPVETGSWGAVKSLFR